MRPLLRAACCLLAGHALAGMAAALGLVVDGTSNTIVIDDRPLVGTGCERVTTRGDAGAAIWTSIYVQPSAGPCGLPIATAPCPVAREPMTRIPESSPSTIYVAESPGTWCVGAIGNGQCAVQSLPAIRDGLSNTIMVGEPLPPIGGADPKECSLRVGGAECAVGGFGTVADGTSNTIGFVLAGPGFGCTLPVAGMRVLPDVRVAPGGGLCTSTLGGIRDGTSNTIVVGECAAPAAVSPEPATLALAGSGLVALGAVARRRRT